MAITLPLHAIRIVPPGTSIRLLLVDGLLVGVGVPDGDADVVPDAEGELLAVPEGVPDGDVDGVAEGDADGDTAPPTAFPFWQVNTYSTAFAGTTNGVGEAVGVGVLGAAVGTLAGEAGGLVDRLARGLADWVVAGAASTGAAVLGATTVGLAAGGDGAVDCVAVACGPRALSKSWVPLTSRPTCSTAVKVTAVIKMHDSTQPTARVRGRPNQPRPPSLARRRGGSPAASSWAEGQSSGP